MDDAERRELWEADLEALEATYGIVDKKEEDGDDENCDGDGGDGKMPPTSSSSSSSILSVLSRSPPSIRALLSPRGCSKSASRFVGAELVLECTQNYPGGEGESEDDDKSSERLVSVSLSSPRGLGDERRALLLRRISAALSEVSASGELCVLGSLIEATLEAITDLNVPEGDCPICLEALVGGVGEEGGGGGGDGESGNNNNNANRLVKLECFHCLHLRCAVRWWGVTEEEEEETKEEEEEEEEEEQGGAGSERKKKKRKKKTLRCPQCRAVAEVASGAAARLDALVAASLLLSRGLEGLPPLSAEPAAAAAAPAAAAAAAAAAAPGTEASSPSSAPPSLVPVSSWGLLPSELARLREERARRREGVARQAARGALVSERWAVSLPELSPPPPPPPPPPPYSSSSSSAAAAAAREEAASRPYAWRPQEEEHGKGKGARPAVAAKGQQQQQQQPRGASRGGRGRGRRSGGGGG